MIPRDDQFDVYVSEHAVAEVWRGDHLSCAQMFGVDWDGSIYSLPHAAMFEAPAAPEQALTSSAAVDEPSRWRCALHWLWHARAVWLWVGWMVGLLAGHWAR